MAIAYKNSATSFRTTGGTTLSATLPTYAAGDLLVFFMATDQITALSGLTGWTQASWSPISDGTTTGEYFVYWKIADGTEGTALSLSWTTSQKPLVTISSYSGVDSTTPVVASSGALDTTNTATVTTPTVNNTGTGVEWALGLFAFRTTTSANKTNTFTPDASLTERSDANMSSNGSATWFTQEVADSNAAVAAGNHSYTGTVVSGGSSTHKFGALLFLNPASAGGSNLTQNIDDSLTVADSLAMGVGLSLADTMTLADAVAMGVGLSLTDNVALADAQSFGIGLQIDDTLALADAISLGLGLSLADSITLADAIAANRGIVLQIDDSVALADATGMGIGLGIDDAISLVDALANSAGLQLDDAITLADHISFLLNGQPFPQTVKSHVRAYFVTKFGFYT